MNKSISSRTWNNKSLELVDWNQNQLDIFEWVKNGTGNGLVIGVAGCGKSTTIIGTLPFIKGKSLLLAFNKHIVKRLQEDSRITKSRVTISTAHSLGLSLITPYLPYTQVNNYKLNSILNKLLKESGVSSLIKSHISNKYNYSLYSQKHLINVKYKVVIENILSITRKIQINLEEPTPTNCLKYLMYYNLDFPLDPSFVIEYIVNLPSLLLKESLDISIKSGVIDFSDMIWLPYKLDIDDVASKEFIIVDECQDVNKAMIHLYKLFINKGARGLFFGDPSQAIFGFAGSDSKSWDLLKEEFSPTELPLSYCYRCPVSHINIAKNFLDIIQPIPNAPYGHIFNNDISQLINEVQPDDLVLSRFNFPLTQICLQLILNNKRAYIIGRDVSKSILNEIDDIYSEHINLDKINPQTFEDILFSRMEQIEDMSSYQLDIYKLDIYKVIHLAVMYIKDRGFNLCVDRLKKLIEKIFEPSPNSVILSTIHRAKGLEANNVWLYGSDSLPSNFKIFQRWQRIQENNILYVALTRAKHSLHFVPECPTRLKNHKNKSIGGITLPNEY